MDNFNELEFLQELNSSIEEEGLVSLIFVASLEKPAPKNNIAFPEQIFVTSLA